jgi:hydrogenase-4 component F
LVAGLFLLMLAIVFIGMGATVLSVVQGSPSKQASATDFRDGLRTGAPILVCMGLVVMLGLYIPPPLETLLRDAAAFVEGRP